jgi:hypothetical protein
MLSRRKHFSIPREVGKDKNKNKTNFVNRYFKRELESTPVWPAALTSRKIIEDYLATNGTSINVGKFKTLPSMHDFFLSRVGQERSSSFDVSNLGIFKNPISKLENGLNHKSVTVEQGNENEVPDWEIGRIVFSRSAFVSGSALSTSVVTGGDGCLVCLLSSRIGCRKSNKIGLRI